MSPHDTPLSHAQLARRAPGWARWLAQDADGSWWCYEHEPNLAYLNWYENEVGRSLRIHKAAPNPCWRDTLFALDTADKENAD